MPEIAVRNDYTLAHSSWGAIWAGVFTFFSIWCVFGLLGMSIFASAGSRNLSTSVGMGIWAIVLTIIAMYVAGRVTGHLASVSSSRDGVIHGIIMFGLTVMTALAVTALGGNNVFGAGATGAHAPYLFGVFADLGWFGFVSLFLGWLAAIGGASAGTHVIHTPVQQMSHAD